MKFTKEVGTAGKDREETLRQRGERAEGGYGLARCTDLTSLESSRISHQESFHSPGSALSEAVRDACLQWEPVVWGTTVQQTHLLGLPCTLPVKVQS